MSHLKMTPQEFEAHVARNRAFRVQRAHPEAGQPRPVPALLQGPPTFGGGAIELTIPGTPVAKGRPRMGGNGHVYTPERTREAEAVVQSVARLHQVVPITGSIVMTLDFFMPIPRSFRDVKGHTSTRPTKTSSANCWEKAIRK